MNMSHEEVIEHAAKMLAARDREEAGMEPKPWDEYSDFMKSVYRSAVTGEE